MIIECEDEELAIFIYTGNAPNKRYKPLSRNKLFMRNLGNVMSILKTVENTDCLWGYGSLHYERLKWDRSGQSGVRIGHSSPYRLLFTEHNSGIKIKLIEISNHYD